jgi:hypothetical protein
VKKNRLPKARISYREESSPDVGCVGGYVLTEESCVSRPSLGVFTRKAPKKPEDLTSLYKKSDEDPTLLTGQSSILSESGNVDGAGSFIEGNRVKLPESKIMKASQKSQAFAVVA